MGVGKTTVGRRIKQLGLSFCDLDATIVQRVWPYSINF